MYNSEHSQNVVNPALQKRTNRKDSIIEDTTGSRTALFQRSFKKKEEIEGEDFEDEMNEKVEASTVDRSNGKQKDIHSATSLDNDGQ